MPARLSCIDSLDRALYAHYWACTIYISYLLVGLAGGLLANGSPTQSFIQYLEPSPQSSLFAIDSSFPPFVTGITLIYDAGRKGNQPSTDKCVEMWHMWPSRWYGSPTTSHKCTHVLDVVERSIKK
jgi:hypothetical protein